jgi:hypothetical protein
VFADALVPVEPIALPAHVASTPYYCFGWIWLARSSRQTLASSDGYRFALWRKGHDTRALHAYLGHKNIQHTVRYTELAPHRFKDFWR